jgi:hypothetical protein
MPQQNAIVEGTAAQPRSTVAGDAPAFEHATPGPAPRRSPPPRAVARPAVAEAAMASTGSTVGRSTNAPTGAVSGGAALLTVERGGPGQTAPAAVGAPSGPEPPGKANVELSSGDPHASLQPATTPGVVAPVETKPEVGATPAVDPTVRAPEFAGLDSVELPPKTASEEREERKLKKVVADFDATEAQKGALMKQLRDISKEYRHKEREKEAQENLTIAESLRGMMAGDLGERGFTLPMIKRLLALIARTPLSAEEVAKLVARHQVK